MNLKITGFKSVDREVALDRLNLVIGSNGAGKSAIADALRFLALGYVPALGKREQDTALLMSNGRLEVVLTLDDQRTATRTLERDGEGYRSTVRASWVRGSRAEHEAGILELFGSDAEDVAEALDIRELLSLSPAKRAARIEKMVGSSSGDDLPRRVARHHVARLLSQDVEQLPEKLGDAIAVLPPSRVSALRGIGAAMQSVLREKGLPGVMAWANEGKREAEKTAKKRHAAKDELEARLSTLGGTLAIQDLESQRAEIQRAIGAQSEAGRREAERSKQFDAAASAKAQIEPTLDDAIGRLDLIETTAQEIVAACEEKLPEYDEAIGALRAQVFGSSKDLDRLHELEAQLDGLAGEPVEDVSRYERMVEEFEAEIAKAGESPWVEVRNIAGRIHSKCPEESARLTGLAMTNLPSTADTERALASARETLQKRGERAAAAAQRNVERASRRSLIEAEIARLRDHAEGADASVKERERKRDIEIEGLEAKKRAARETIADQKRKVSDQRNHVQQLREKLSGLTARVLALSNPIELPVAPDLGELDRIETAIKSATQRKALAAELQSIIDELEERDAEVEVYRALEFALQRCREEELATSGVGIVATIGNFLHAAGRTELPYMEAGKNVCDVGWVRADHRRVSIEAMSGGEYALFCAALTASVLQARGGELRVLLIEGAEADGQTLAQIMSGVEAMGGLSHALVLTCSGPVAQRSDSPWCVVVLQPEEVAA